MSCCLAYPSLICEKGRDGEMVRDDLESYRHRGPAWCFSYMCIADSLRGSHHADKITASSSTAATEKIPLLLMVGDWDREPN